MSSTASMTIGELAEAAGVGVETVRYYQRRGLVDEPKRSRGSIRRYGSDILERIQFIKRAQALGFTLQEIRAVFALDARRDRDRAHRVAQHKLEQLTQRLT